MRELKPTGRRVALVTGGARGIGAAIVARLSAEGWQVVVVDRSQPAQPGPGRFIQADAASEADVAGVLDSVRAQEGRLDGLVCNAGIMIRKPLADLTLGEWNQVLATNLTSSFLFARASQDLLAKGPGAIVTIASTRARQSEPDTESYAASKGGLVALTHALAISLGPIRVNCISPGWINVKDEALRPEDTDQHPTRSVGTPDDIAALASFLLNPESRFITGTEVTADGGMTRRMIYAE